MRKKDMLLRYSELANNRDIIASVSVEALQKLAENEDGLLDQYELAIVHDSIIDATMRDAENDQREIANLIAVANSTEFPEDVRTEASRRAITMLEL